MMEPVPDVTQMLLKWSDGDREALDRLIPIVYEQLRRMARAQLRAERADHTLNTTGLVHEAYIRLVDVNRVRWESRAHFLAMAARLMRRILVDYALKRKAVKRGGDQQRVELDDDLLISDAHVETMVELDDALTRLEASHPRQSKAIELRYFGGLTLEEAAEVLKVSPPTVMRDLIFAEAWLARAWGGKLGG